MNIDEIIRDLKEKRIWNSSGSDAYGLRRCVFCGGEAVLMARNPVYGVNGAWVRCRWCGAQGPRAGICAMILTPASLSTPVIPESLERGLRAAAEAWNSRTVTDRASMGNLVIEARS